MFNIYRQLFDIKTDVEDSSVLRNSILLALLLGVIFFTCFWKLDSQSFSNLDEALHVSVVQETTNWFNPRLRDRPYLNKPPLKMMLTEVPIKLLGNYKYSYRIIDALSGAATVLLTSFLAYLFFRSYSIGFLSGLILLGSRSFIHEHSVRLALQDLSLIHI